MTEALNIAIICRTCMKESLNLIDIFDPYPGECDCKIAEAIIMCTSTEVNYVDNFPRKICKECLSLLQISFDFRAKALKVYSELENLLSQVCIKNEGFDDDINETDYSNYQDDNSKVDKKENLSNWHNDGVSEITKKYECHICLKKYKKRNNLTKHLITHEEIPVQFPHGPDPKIEIKNDDESPTSDVNFPEMPVIQGFVENNSRNQKRFECYECGAIYDTKKKLKIHTHKHTRMLLSNLDDIRCDVCNLVFSKIAVLKRHKKLHAKEKPYACIKCSKSFTRSDELSVHMFKHEGKKPYKCNVCGKAFTQLCSLKDHSRIHTGETPFLCSECGKGFNHKSNLRQHIFRHSGLRPFSCSFCPKMFASKGQKVRHMVTHTDSRPHSCPVCKSCFTTPSSLRKHQLIHLGVRPFACESCPMSFTCKDHLKRHERKHTGEKPYKCVHCERAFTQSNDLNKHLRRHVGINIHPCTVCGLKFRTNTELKQHYPTHYITDGEIPNIQLSKDKSAPIVVLKPNTTNVVPSETIETNDPKDLKYTITISRNMDKNGIAGELTINFDPEKN